MTFVKNKTREMQTHAGRLGLGFYLWPFELRASACRGPAMDYGSTDFGADSSSLLECGQTDRQTQLNAFHQAAVGNK